MALRSTSFFLFLAALVAQPAAAATSPTLQYLEQRLTSLAAQKSADVGIAALDLRSGELISVNGQQAYPMASVVKIAVAANYLAQVEHGRRSLDDRIGGTTAAKLIEAMLIRSSNPATDMLIRDLGGPQTVQAWLTQQNLSGIRMDRTIAQLLNAKRDLWDVRDSATPVAMVELLRRIDSGQMLRPWSRDYLLGVMARCMTGSNRMRALLPDGTRVEHKTGTLSGLSTDVGFITMPDGRRIAVAFFARGGSDRPRTIAEAARAIYDGFVETIRSPFAMSGSAPVSNRAAFNR